MWYNSTVTVMKNLEIAYNNSIGRLFQIPKHTVLAKCVYVEHYVFWGAAQKYIYNYI